MNKTSSAALYGRGIFTTAAIYGGAPCLWARHWRRLEANAETVGIDLSGHTEASVLAALAAEIERRGVEDGKVRVTFFDERPAALWNTGDFSGARTSVGIAVSERRAPRPLCVGISPFPVNSRSPLAGVKSCSYLEPLLAREDAHKRGFDEALRINERGKIAGAALANVFWRMGGELFTPALSTGCLAGTTRGHVLDALACAEVEADIGVLSNADAIFLTSAGLGIARIGEFDGRKLSDEDDPVLRQWPPQQKVEGARMHHIHDR